MVKKYKTEEEKKEAKRLYRKKWREDNKEKVKEQKKLYYQKNKEKIRERAKVYYQKNKAEINKNNKKWLQENKEARREYKKKYNEENKEKISEQKKLYRLKNKEARREYQKKYYEKNREKKQEWRRGYDKKRRRNDPVFKFKVNLRKSISRGLKKVYTVKDKSTEDILGCSFKELKQHIESQWEDWMTWDNYGLCNGNLNHGWDIDHIKPLSLCETKEDVYKLNHYTNLQPLCSYTNRYIKRDNIN